MSTIEINDQFLKRTLEESKTIAIIGCSDKKYRTSYFIAQYLKSAGYEIVPVNPNIDSCLGVKAYELMHDIQPDKTIDIVDIFRNKRYTTEMVEQIVEWSENTGQKPLVWTQLDVSTEEAMKLAREAGLPYVKNQCLMVQHKRLT